MTPPYDNKRAQRFTKMLNKGGMAFKLSIYLRTLLLVFGLSFSLLLVLFCIFYLADSHGLIQSEKNAGLVTFVTVMLGGMTVSLILTIFINRLLLLPMRQILNAIHQVGRGNFDVRIKTDDLHEIGFLAASINQMIESLGSLEMLRNDFIANVSHEFKTPLASIQGCAALLQSEDLTPEERRRYAELVYSSAKRLSNLSSNILELSKLEHGDVQVNKTEFMLDEHLRQALLLLQSDWQQKQLDLNLELPEVKYYGSDELLMQVWVNLLGNAIKFSPPGGRISVILEKLPSALSVTISDEGVGIAEADQRLIFEKFYQSDTSHKTEGNGLGLAMVRQIITLLGADISVVSSPGVGSAFTVTLPIENPV